MERQTSSGDFLPCSPHHGPPKHHSKGKRDSTRGKKGGPASNNPVRPCTLSFLGSLPPPEGPWGGEKDGQILFILPQKGEFYVKEKERRKSDQRDDLLPSHPRGASEGGGRGKKKKRGLGPSLLFHKDRPPVVGKGKLCGKVYYRWGVPSKKGGF